MFAAFVASTVAEAANAFPPTVLTVGFGNVPLRSPPAGPIGLAPTTGAAQLPSPRRYVPAFAFTPALNKLTDNVPLVIFVAFVVSVVADATKALPPVFD